MASRFKTSAKAHPRAPRAKALKRRSVTSRHLAHYFVTFTAKTPAAFDRAVAAVRPHMDAHFEDWSADFSTSGSCQVVAYTPKMTWDDAIEIAAMLDPVCKKTARIVGGAGVARVRRKSARTVRSLPARKPSGLKRKRKPTLPGRRGSLHRALGVPEGKKISIAKLRTAARGRGVLAARARRALNLRGVKTKNMRRMSLAEARGVVSKMKQVERGKIAGTVRKF